MKLYHGTNVEFSEIDLKKSNRFKDFGRGFYLTDIRQDMMQSRDYCCAFHMKETRPNKYGGLFYGEGHVDFQEIMRIAWKDLGIRRFVMEYWYTGNPEWQEDMRKANNLCRYWINKSL